VVATAWGTQQRLGSAEDPELGRFVGTYGHNPGSGGGGEHSSCTGGRAAAVKTLFTEVAWKMNSRKWRAGLLSWRNPALVLVAL
jgi:hypothetical protein